MTELFLCLLGFIIFHVNSVAVPRNITNNLNKINLLNTNKPLQGIIKNKTDGVEQEVSIIFAGDISMDKPIRNGNGSACAYSELMTNMKKYFKSADYNMVNVEAPFVTRQMAKNQAFPGKGINNMQWEESVDALVKAEIKGATLANNHMTDFGGDAVAYTKKILQDNGIDVIGLTSGKKSPYGKQRALVKDIKGIRIAFLGYCGDLSGECEMFRKGVKQGPALLNRKIVRADIDKLKKLKPRVDHIITFVHWGKEYMSIPNEEQRQLAIELRKLGVKVIVGSHPHVKQGHEWINDTLVHYSLGNFLFHPHYTFMGGLKGRKGKDEIHQRAIEQSKLSRGPAGFTELFKIILTKEKIKAAYYLPVRVHVDKKTSCLYPKARKEDGWEEVCGSLDDNCYYPRVPSTA